MYPTNIELLEQTKQAFTNIRSSIVDAMQKLYQVYQSKAWEGVCGSWGEYVETELEISQGFASKLLSVNKHYLLDEQVSPEKLVGIDYEKLYAATKLPGSVEEQLAKAQTLTRAELRQEKSEAEPHSFEEIKVCKNCWLTEEKHP